MHALALLSMKTDAISVEHSYDQNTHKFVIVTRSSELGNSLVLKCYIFVG